VALILISTIYGDERLKYCTQVDRKERERERENYDSSW